MKICFTDEGFDDYNYWVAEDKKILKKINLLIKAYREMVLKVLESLKY